MNGIYISIAFVCLVASFICLFAAIKRIALVRSTKGWTMISGRIVNSVVEPVMTKEGGYRVLIKYAYEINGREYENDRTDFGLLSSKYINGKLFQTKASATKYAEWVNNNKNVEIWFDHDNPLDSTIDKSFPFLFILIQVALSFLFLSLAIYSLCGGSAPGTSNW